MVSNSNREKHGSKLVILIKIRGKRLRRILLRLFHMPRYQQKNEVHNQLCIKIKKGHTHMKIIDCRIIVLKDVKTTYVR